MHNPQGAAIYPVVQPSRLKAPGWATDGLKLPGNATGWSEILKNFLCIFTTVK